MTTSTTLVAPGRPFRRGYDARRRRGGRGTGLTPRQEIFCREYLLDLNASAAARRAGYSRQSASRQAQENLQKPMVQERIRQLMAERAERLQLAGDQVVAELAKIAFSDIREIVEWSGDGVKLRPSSEVLAPAAAAVREIRGTADGPANKAANDDAPTLEIVLHDKVQALELLARHLGMG